MGTRWPIPSEGVEGKGGSLAQDDHPLQTVAATLTVDGAPVTSPRNAKPWSREEQLRVWIAKNWDSCRRAGCDRSRLGRQGPGGLFL